MLDESGFLLGEALIAFALLCLGLFAVFQAFALAGAACKRAEHNALIATCAQEQLIARVAQHSASQASCLSMTWTDETTPLSPQLVRVMIKSSLDNPGQGLMFETIAHAE